ncbi:hypothetical protein ACNG34_000554 [Enterococcus faecium]
MAPSVRDAPIDLVIAVPMAAVATTPFSIETNFPPSIPPALDPAADASGSSCFLIDPLIPFADGIIWT